MSILYYIFIICLTLLLSILDISYLSFLEVSGSSILISYAVLIVLALFGRKRSTWVFSVFLILFYSVFSSLPVIFLILIFLIVPYLIQILKTKITTENNPLAIVLIFFVSNMIFEGILILIGRDFSITAFNSLVSFTLINSIPGIAIYYLSVYFTKSFGLKK